MAKKADAESTAKTPRRKEKPDCPPMPQNSAASEMKSVPSAKSAEVASLRAATPLRLKPSSLLDTRVVYCGDNLEQLAKLPAACDSAFRTPHSAIAVAGSFYYHYVFCLKAFFALGRIEIPT